MAEVAEYYPRLLIWLREGQVGGVWNVFGMWCSVLRLIPGARWLLWLTLFKPVADAAPWRVALYGSILQQRRRVLNEPSTPGSQPAPAADEPPSAKAGRLPLPGVGLSAVTGEALVLPTGAREDLHKRIVTMSSGCIGIGGLRGVGKTTIIQDFCANRYGTPRQPAPPGRNHFLPGLRITVQAPIKFDAREFLIHQYTCLCRAVQADPRFNPTTLGRQLVFLVAPRRIRFGTLLGMLSGVIFFAGSAVLGYRAASGTWPNPFDNLLGWEISGAVVAFIAGLVAIGWRTGRAVREIHQVVNLASEAGDRLHRLQYQRTDTRTAGGTISAPLGVGVSIGTGREFTQQLMSLPELIADYRDFVQRVVGGLEQAAGARYGRRRDDDDLSDWSVRLVIGIDQLDQIEDPQAACKFIDELSAEFGVPNCVYLLAVSPATMTALDQRAVPLKTSSGGRFDEMIWVEPFGLVKSTELLNARVIWLSPLLTALCYVLSGGLPRELLRIARSVIRAVNSQGESEGGLDAMETPVVDAVIREEVRALKHRVLASAVANDTSGTFGLIEKQLTDDSWPWHAPYPDAGQVIEDILKGVPPASHRRAPLQAAAEDAQDDISAAVCNSLIAGSYFLFTVRELFALHQDVVECLSKELTDSERTREEQALADGRPPGVLAELARARIALGVSPDLAADLVSAARTGLKSELENRGQTGSLSAPVRIEFLHRHVTARPQPARPA